MGVCSSPKKNACDRMRKRILYVSKSRCSNQAANMLRLIRPFLARCPRVCRSFIQTGKFLNRLLQCKLTDSFSFANDVRLISSSACQPVNSNDFQEEIFCVIMYVRRSGLVRPEKVKVNGHTCFF